MSIDEMEPAGTNLRNKLQNQNLKHPKLDASCVHYGMV